MNLSIFTHVSAILSEMKRDVQIQKYKIILETRDKVVQGIFKNIDKLCNFHVRLQSSKTKL